MPTDPLTVHADPLTVPRRRRARTQRSGMPAPRGGTAPPPSSLAAGPKPRARRCVWGDVSFLHPPISLLVFVYTALEFSVFSSQCGAFKFGASLDLSGARGRRCGGTRGPATDCTTASASFRVPTMRSPKPCR
eukprot:1114909-Prorocentrum_minimum.AAC.1